MEVINCIKLIKYCRFEVTVGLRVSQVVSGLSSAQPLSIFYRDNNCDWRTGAILYLNTVCFFHLTQGNLLVLVIGSLFCVLITIDSPNSCNLQTSDVQLTILVDILKPYDIDLWRENCLFPMLRGPVWLNNSSVFRLIQEIPCTLYKQ